MRSNARIQLQVQIIFLSLTCVKACLLQLATLTIDCGIMQRMAFESLTLKEQDIVLRCMKATAAYVDDCEKRLT